MRVALVAIALLVVLATAATVGERIGRAWGRFNRCELFVNDPGYFWALVFRCE